LARFHFDRLGKHGTPSHLLHLDHLRRSLFPPCWECCRRAYGLTAEEEKSLGKKTLEEIEKSGDILDDRVPQKFINRVGQSLVAEAGPTPFELKFSALKSQQPNAFAVPGGYVFVTSGLLGMAENEQEIAGVLGHEIAHVARRHISNLIERSKGINLVTLAAMIGAMAVAKGGLGGQAIAATVMATQEALVLKYTREEETDADHNGLRYLVKTEYDPNGLLSFLQKISKYGMIAEPKMPTYLMTHPG
jgi:predicted Zn-dependent protease